MCVFVCKIIKINKIYCFLHKGVGKNNNMKETTFCFEFCGGINFVLVLIFSR